ncbi:hypothetical protein F5148DRAFT_48567 [Russula earlei]|uniref:Uncharacterized protein n=1 Tax=Russula earlei TaxID=71964 RepID=A0ACC0UAL1_9AGAM|nr:hypothetical protein F5148DRAFT_48567 [Russula earlei]
MHKPTTPSTSVENAMLPSTELTTQCDKANGTSATAAAEAAAMRCTTTRHDDRMEHAHVHALPLSTAGWSTLTPPSPAFLPHAPACDDLERSIIPLFVASSSSLLGLSVASSLSSCKTEDLGTAAVMTIPHGHMAENSTLDSLTEDSQNFMPLGGRYIVDCGWPRNSLLHGCTIAPIVRPVTSRLPSRHLPHVPRPRSQELAATDRHVPAQPLETTPRRLVSFGLTPSTDLDFLSYACLSFRPFLSLGSSLVYKSISRIQGVALLFPSL